MKSLVSAGHVAFAAFAALSSLSLSAFLAPGTAQALQLRLLGDGNLPFDESFQATPLGGMSALAYDPVGPELYAQSDDRSGLAPARVYTFSIDVTASGFAVSPKSVTTLRDSSQQPFASGSIDPEGIALSPWGTLFVS